MSRPSTRATASSPSFSSSDWSGSPAAAAKSNSRSPASSPSPPAAAPRSHASSSQIDTPSTTTDSASRFDQSSSSEKRTSALSTWIRHPSSPKTRSSNTSRLALACAIQSPPSSKPLSSSRAWATRVSSHGSRHHATVNSKATSAAPTAKTHIAILSLKILRIDFALSPDPCRRRDSMRDRLPKASQRESPSAAAQPLDVSHRPL